MATVVFYDMPASARLPWIAQLAERAWQRGKRMLIHCGSEADVQELDEALWCFKEEAFVPHEVVAVNQAPRDREARIVITAAEHNPLAATILLADAPPTQAFAERFETVLEVVDHRNASRLQASRDRYRMWRKLGADVSYKKCGPETTRPGRTLE